MSTDRTPEEMREAYELDVRIAAILDDAIDNIASWIVADRLDEPAEVCELWVDRVWDGLRDNLSDEERLAAIVQLLHPHAEHAAREILRGAR